MLGTSCSLEISETVLTEQRKPERTEEGMVSASSRDASTSDVLMESVKINNHAESPPLPGPKRNNPHNLAQIGMSEHKDR